MFVAELYGCSGTNSSEVDIIPRQCQLAPDVPQQTQVHAQSHNQQMVMYKLDYYGLSFSARSFGPVNKLELKLL